MKSDAKSIETIDQYIAQFSKKQQEILQDVRNCIRAAAPKAEEAIKYQMPTFCLHGNLIHFAICKNHLGVYPTPSAILHFAQELLPYKTSKGAIQFPLSEKIPLALIKKITKFRVQEMVQKNASKNEAHHGKTARRIKPSK